MLVSKLLGLGFSTCGARRILKSSDMTFLLRFHSLFVHSRQLQVHASKHRFKINHNYYNYNAYFEFENIRYLVENYFDSLSNG